jgi:hypothetical protein
MKPHQDFIRVTPTTEELDDFWRKRGRRPGVNRVQCRHCGKRYWGSGIAVGAHRRACAAPTCAWENAQREREDHESSA